MERPNRRETPVVPLHAHRPPSAPRTAGGLALAEPAPALPAEPPARRPETAESVRGARARRATANRQAHDGWTFVIVPPGVGARPRTLHISTRRFRMAAASLATVTGAGVVCAALLALMVSFAPAVQEEAAGVDLGLFDSYPAVAPQTLVPQQLDLLSLLAIGPAAPTVANPTPEDVKAAERPVGPRTDVARAKAERRRVIAAPSMSGERTARAAVLPANVEGLPVIGRITSRFTSSRRHPVLGVVRPHRGVDIAAASGTPIHAPAAGRVIFSGRKFGFGNVVEIDHGNGIITRYAHCRTLRVKGGAKVEAGATIATVGRTGLASGPHLHFEVLVDGKSVDPLAERVEALIAARSPSSAPAPSGMNLLIPGMPAALVAPGMQPTSDSTTARDEDAADAADAGDVVAGEQPNAR